MQIIKGSGEGSNLQNLITNMQVWSRVETYFITRPVVAYLLGWLVSLYKYLPPPPSLRTRNQ